jgi:hypothetical protein
LLWQQVFVDKANRTVGIQAASGRDAVRVAGNLQRRSLQDPQAALRPPLLWRHSERITNFVRTVRVRAAASCDSTKSPVTALSRACPFALIPACAP